MNVLRFHRLLGSAPHTGFSSILRRASIRRALEPAGRTPPVSPPESHRAAQGRCRRWSLPVAPAPLGLAARLRCVLAHPAPPCRRRAPLEIHFSLGAL